MTIKTMRIFTEVCKNESITLAAKVMGTSQPSVSTAIKELETQFGVKLFDRMSNRLYITEAGRQMYHQISDILMKIDELSSIKEHEVQRSTLRVGVEVFFSLYPYPKILSRFNAENSDIEILTYIYDTERLEQMLLDNDLDIIIALKPMSERLKKQKIGQDEFVYLCSKEYRKHLPQNPSIAELSNQKFLLLDTGIKKFDYFHESLQGGGRTVMKSISGEPLIFAALDSLGLYCTSRKHAENLMHIVPDYADYIIPTNTESFEYYYSYHSQKLVDRSLERFIDTTEKICAEIY